jgi:HTH-type transcriptional regulator/antitoxin HigA
MKTKTTKTSIRLPSTFEGLCKLRWPLPIHDRVNLDNTLEIVDRLAGRADLTPGQEQYLETMTVLIEAYETRSFPVRTTQRNPIEILKYLLQGRGMSASDLGRLLGNRSLGSAIISRRRGISKAHAIALGKLFAVSPGLFL